MTRFSKITAVAFALAALALWLAPAAHAQCGVSTPYGNFLGTVANCDDSGPVVGTIQAISSTGAVVSTVDNTFICRTQTQPDNCLATRAGAVGDGLIAFGGDWANAPATGLGGVNGCPTGGVARGRNFLNVTDASGNKLLLSVGFDTAIAGYRYDNAWPADGTNLACTNPRSGVTLVSSTTTGSQAQVALRCNLPQIRSDCDPGSRGQVLQTGSCQTADLDLLNGIRALTLYRAVADCSGRGLNYDVAKGGWTPQAATDDGTGLLSALIDIPTTGCAFLGCTYGTVTVGTSGFCQGVPALACTSSAFCESIIPGSGPCVFPETRNEYSQVSSAIAIAPTTAPSPRALDVAVGFDRGKAFVSFRTETELGLVGFEILRNDPKAGLVKIGDFVAPRGINGAGATYSIAFNPGDLRRGGSKSVAVRSLLTDGSGILSDPASF